jgi:hypothetical protein
VREGLLVKNYLSIAILVLVAVSTIWWGFHVDFISFPAKAATTNLGQYPDCAKHSDFGVIVRSSVDRKYYFIQTCVVADSAAGEDFRHEVPNKPCDVPESHCK